MARKVCELCSVRPASRRMKIISQRDKRRYPDLVKSVCSSCYRYWMGRG